MYRTIMVPVDFAHLDTINKALETAGDLANHYQADIVYAGVTTETPSPEARSPEEFASRLSRFATRQSEVHGRPTRAHAVASPDPTTDLERTLLRAAAAEGADLIVMASHKPGLADLIWSSHGGAIAAEAPMSVMLVR